MKKGKTITLAIHTPQKAKTLKLMLENKGITVTLENLDSQENLDGQNNGVAVKIDQSQINDALAIMEEYKIFNYNDALTYQMDDGRNRILVAVDFSSYSMKACQIAFSIAKETRAKVKILHVYNNIYFPSHIPFANMLKEKNEPSMLDKARKQILELCMDIDKKIINGDFPSVNYSYSLREGIIEEEIESFIEEYKPILLVLGKKGNNNKENSILGSITADIIEMTDVPVMAIPENSPIKNVQDIKHLAFFTNFQERDLISFDYLANAILSLYTEIKITLVHINIKNKNGEKWGIAELSKMQDFFKNKYSNPHVTYKLIDDIPILPQIKDFVQKEKVDMITLNTQRRNVFKRIFIPSTSRKILSSINIPLLILRGKSLIKLKYRTHG